MHVIMAPHCANCEYFYESCITDVTTQWGYCILKVEDEAAFKKELESIKREVESGNYEPLLTRGQAPGLFVPTFTNCKHFSNFYPW